MAKSKTSNWPIHNYPQTAGSSSSQMPFTNFQTGNQSQAYGAYAAIPAAGTGSNPFLNFHTSTYQMEKPSQTISCSFCASVPAVNGISNSFSVKIPAFQSSQASFCARIPKHS